MRDYNNSKSLQSKVCVKDFGFYMELLSKNFKQPYGGYVGIVCYNLIKQITNSCLYFPVFLNLDCVRFLVLTVTEFYTNRSEFDC